MLTTRPIPIADDLEVKKASKILKRSNSCTGSSDWHIRRLHVVPSDLPVSRLPCKEAWDSLSDVQRHFVHHFAQASWSGSRICAHQISQVRNIFPMDHANSFSGFTEDRRDFRFL